MREIKFRGQTYDTPPHWVFGDLYHYTTGEPAINYPHPHKKWLESEPVRPATVGQFTGLLDSDGKEIYEGDIVKCGTGRICEVVYFLSPVHCGYDLNPVGGFDCKPPSEFTLWSDLKVIGNIHDSPELLEEDHLEYWGWGLGICRQ